MEVLEIIQSVICNQTSPQQKSTDGAWTNGYHSEQLGGDYFEDSELH